MSKKSQNISIEDVTYPDFWERNFGADGSKVLALILQKFDGKATKYELLHAANKLTNNRGNRVINDLVDREIFAQRADVIKVRDRTQLGLRKESPDWWKRNVLDDDEQDDSDDKKSGVSLDKEYEDDISLYTVKFRHKDGRVDMPKPTIHVNISNFCVPEPDETFDALWEDGDKSALSFRGRVTGRHFKYYQSSSASGYSDVTIIIYYEFLDDQVPEDKRDAGK